MMYDELIAELRQHHCDAKEDDTQEVCEECAYDVIIADESVPSGIASVCVCGLMHRAADAIEQLSNAGSAYGRGWTLGYDAGREESKPRWTPVTGRPPKDAGVYLCRIKSFNGNFRYTDTMKYVDGLFYEQGVATDRVTHWMPLPEPPKES